MISGSEIKNRALDAKTFGVALQSQARERSDAEGYAEPHLWTGVGRARSGCGMALVGSPAANFGQVAALSRHGNSCVYLFRLSAFR